MFRNSKYLRIALTLVFTIVFGEIIPPAACGADREGAVSSSGYESEHARKKRAQEEVKEQKRNFKISQYLDKARKLRNDKNFKGARTMAQKALKLDKDSAEAHAFLEQLDAEEKANEEYKRFLEQKKEDEQKTREEALLRAREKETWLKQQEEKAAEDAQKSEKAEKEARRKKIEEDRLEAEQEKLKKEAQAEKEKAEQKDLVPKKVPVKEEAVVEKKKTESLVRSDIPEKKEAPKKKVKKTPVEKADLSQLATPGKAIVVDGDKVEFFESEGKIVAEGNVSITYGDVLLTCDRIMVNTQTRQALCEGDVRIEQGGRGTLVGERIRYDFLNKEDEIIGGELDAFPWFAQAEETGKVGENEYLLKKGYVSTCDLDEPHYRIEAEQIRIFPGEKVIAKNVIVRIGKVPVLWLPYYYHPIIYSRAKVQFIPGWETDWGYFLLSAWRFYIKGNTKVDVLLDYRTEKGFAEGANLYYDFNDVGIPYLGKGLFRAYFIHQNDWGTYKKGSFRSGDSENPELRERYQWKHRIDFEPETVGMFEVNKTSDEYVLKDYFYNEYEENNRVPRNYMSIISTKSNYIFSLEVNKRFNNFYTVTQSLPELKLEVPDQRLWDTPLYYTTEMSVTNFEKDYAFETSPTENVVRFDTYHKLSYVTGLGPVNFTPYGVLRETIYSNTRANQYSIEPRFAVGGGLSVFSRFHRIYDVKSDYLGIEINDLRHIIVPSADYFHLRKPTVDKNKLYQMDEIDELEKENGVTLSLENKLQTKRNRGGEMKGVDFVRSIISVDYMFRMEKDNFKLKESGEFEDLKFELELLPYDWFYVQSKLEITPKNQAVKDGYIEASIKPNKDFEMAAGYRYEKKAPESRNQLTLDVSYRLSPKWKIGWYERFDIRDGRIEEQQFSITRDLHCWEVEFVYDLEGGNPFEDEFTFWFAFKIKAFPDLPLGLDRSFDKRPPGSINN